MKLSEIPVIDDNEEGDDSTEESDEMAEDLCEAHDLLEASMGHLEAILKQDKRRRFLTSKRRGEVIDNVEEIQEHLGQWLKF